MLAENKNFLIAKVLFFVFLGLLISVFYYVNVYALCSSGQTQCYGTEYIQLCQSGSWGPPQICSNDICDTSCGYGSCLFNQVPNWSCEQQSEGNAVWIYDCIPDLRCEIDECEFAGKTQCLDNNYYKMCVDQDSDQDLEWSSPYWCTGSIACGYGDCDIYDRPVWRCSGNKCGYDCQYDSSCLGNLPPSCSNECGIDETTCYLGMQILFCGQYDEDDCREWSDPQVCIESMACGYGACGPLEKPNWLCVGSACTYSCLESSYCNLCEDECSYQGEVRCIAAYYKDICGNYDEDDCLEWRDYGDWETCVGDTSCGYGTCQDNQRPDWKCISQSCVYDCVNASDCDSPCPGGCSGDTSCGYGKCDNNQRPQWYCNMIVPWGICTYNCVFDSGCGSSGNGNGSNGSNGTGCVDQCALRGQSQCFDNINKQTCDSFYDSDSCLEWSPLESCLGNESCGYELCSSNETPRWFCRIQTGECEYACEDNPVCSGVSEGDECSYEGETSCVSQTHKRMCGYYDSDPYLDWSSPETCILSSNCGEQGCSENQRPEWRCENGQCIYNCVDASECAEPVSPPEVCEDECPARWQTRCVDDGRVQTCGYYYDDDMCLEWGPGRVCAVSDDCGYGNCEQGEKPINWHCSDGKCQYECLQDESCPEELPSDYIKEYRKGCYDNDIYWFDSNGVLQDKEEECSDDDEETIDGCRNNDCFNSLAEIGSPEYCENVDHCGDGFCNCGEDMFICFDDCELVDLEILILAKKESEEDFKENISAPPKERIDFNLLVRNKSSQDFDNLIVKVNLPEEIIYKGDLKMEEVFLGEDIRQGINIGFLSLGLEKKINFKGEISSKAAPDAELDIGAELEMEDLSFSDSMTILVEKEKTGVLKWIISRWYFWLLLWAGFVVFLYWILRKSSVRE